MIKELEQIKFLLEDINKNVVQKISEKNDFQEILDLEHSKREIAQEKKLLQYIRSHLTPETKIGRVDDLQKKSNSLTQSLKEIAQEKKLLQYIHNQLMTKDSIYQDILDTLTTEFKTPLIPIKTYSKSLLEGEYGNLSQIQKKEVKKITKKSDLLLDMISELIVSKNIDKVKTIHPPEKLHDSLQKMVIKNKQIKEQDNILHFSEQTNPCPIGIIDIVGSTKIVASLSEKRMGDFFGIFINDFSAIIKKFDGIVVKNIGDGLLFYFSDTKQKLHKNVNQESVENAIKCGFEIINYHSIINKKLSKLGLPKLDYKISFSVGGIHIAKISTSSIDDIFGLAINICSKINSLCPPNSIVVTQKFCDIIDSYDWLQSEKLSEYILPNSKIQVYLIR
jgi:class 3 adenylate cyclase